MKLEGDELSLVAIPAARWSLQFSLTLGLSLEARVLGRGPQWLPREAPLSGLSMRAPGTLRELEGLWAGDFNESQTASTGKALLAVNHRRIRERGR